jgi:hypothetical protein
MLLSFNSNTMGTTSGAETAYPSETPEFRHLNINLDPYKTNGRKDEPKYKPGPLQDKWEER